MPRTTPDDELTDTEKAILECLALSQCGGDPESAKHLVAMRLWARSRVLRAPGDRDDTTVVEIPRCTE